MALAPDDPFAALGATDEEDAAPASKPGVDPFAALGAEDESSFIKKSVDNDEFDPLSYAMETGDHATAKEVAWQKRAKPMTLKRVAGLAKRFGGAAVDMVHDFGGGIGDIAIDTAEALSAPDSPFWQKQGIDPATASTLIERAKTQQLLRAQLATEHSGGFLSKIFGKNGFLAPAMRKLDKLSVAASPDIDAADAESAISAADREEADRKANPRKYFDAKFDEALKHAKTAHGIEQGKIQQDDLISQGLKGVDYVAQRMTGAKPEDINPELHFQSAEDLTAAGAPIDPESVKRGAVTADPINLAPLHIPAAAPVLNKIAGVGLRTVAAPLRATAAIIEKVPALAKKTGVGKYSLAGGVGGIATAAMHNPALLAKGAIAYAGPKVIGHVLDTAGRKLINPKLVTAAEREAAQEVMETGKRGFLSTKQNLADFERAASRIAQGAASAPVAMAPLNAAISDTPEEFAAMEGGLTGFGGFAGGMGYHPGKGFRPETIQAVDTILREKGATKKYGTDLDAHHDAFMKNAPDWVKDGVNAYRGFFDGFKFADGKEPEIYVLPRDQFAAEAVKDDPSLSPELASKQRGFKSGNGKVVINGDYGAGGGTEAPSVLGHEAGGHVAQTIMEFLAPDIDASMQKAATRNLLNNGKPNQKLKNFIAAYNKAFDPTGKTVAIQSNDHAIQEFLAEQGRQVLEGAGPAKFAAGKALRETIADNISDYFRRTFGTKQKFDRAEVPTLAREYRNMLFELGRLRGDHPDPAVQQQQGQQQAPAPAAPAPAQPLAHEPGGANDRGAVAESLKALGYPSKMAQQMAAAAQGVSVEEMIKDALAKKQTTPAVPPSAPSAPVTAQNPATGQQEAAPATSGDPVAVAEPEKAPLSDFNPNEPNQAASTGGTPGEQKPDLTDFTPPGVEPVSAVSPDDITGALIKAEQEAQPAADRARSGGKKAAIVRQARVKALSDLLKPDAPGLKPVTHPETGEVTFRGEVDPESPVHAAILNEFGYTPEHVASILELQAGKGKGVILRDYNAAEQEGHETGEGLDLSGDKRGKEYAASPTGDVGQRQGLVTKQDKAFTPYETVLTNKGVLIRGFDHDKFLGNLRSVIDAKNGLGGEKVNYSDEEIADAFRKVAENHANGFKGDGSEPLKTFPDTGVKVNEDYGGQAVPKKLADIINMAMNIRSARPPKAPRGNSELAMARFGVAADAAKEAQGLAQLNEGFLNRDTGETNPLRDQLEKAGFETDKQLKPTISNIRPDLIEGGIHDTPTHGRNVHAHGFDIAPADLTPQGTPRAKPTAAGFMPGDGEESEPSIKSKVTEAANKAGYKIQAAHSTNAGPFTVFKTDNLSAHFGTEKAAQDRAQQLRDFSVNVVGRKHNEARVMPLFLKIENPLKLPDLASLTQDQRGEIKPIKEAREEWMSKLSDEDREAWENPDDYEGDVQDDIQQEYGDYPRPMAWESETDFSEVLRDKGLISNDEFWEVQHDPQAAVELLKEKGYDGIEYVNDVEDAGSVSHIVFDPSQVKSAEDFTKDDAGKDVPMEERFNPENPDIRFMPGEGGGKPLEDFRPEQDKLGFYSRLAKHVDQAAFGRTKPKVAEHWLGVIDKWAKGADTPTLGQRASGIAKEELEFSGIREWLKSQGSRPINKQEVQDFIKQGGVRIKEVTKAANIEQIKDVDAKIRETQEELNRAISEPDETFSQDAVADARTRLDALLNYRDFPGDPDHAEDERLRGFVTQGLPKFQNYSLPGGRNYKEILLTLPELKTGRTEAGEWNIFDKDGNNIGTAYGRTEDDALKEFADFGDPVQGVRAVFKTGGRNERIKEGFKSAHWAERNVLAHIRQADHEDTEGNKVRLIEEIQSDWHQKGRKEGYATKENSKKFEEAKAEKTAFVEMLKGKYGTAVGPQYSDAANNRWLDSLPESEMNEFTRLNDRVNELSDKLGTIPDAPFKKTWAELAFKRALRMAVDDGMDKIAWTPGKEQIDRFEEELRKNVDEIHYEPYDGFPEWVEMVYGKGTKPEEWMRDNYNKSEMGKGGLLYEIAAYKDGNLVFSEEGADADRAAELLGKEMAAKITKGEGEKMTDAPARDWRIFKGDDLAIGGEGMKGFYDKMLPDFVRKYVKKWGGKVEKTVIDTDDGPTGVHSVTITPEMREAIKGGQPLFMPGEEGGQLAKFDKEDMDRHAENAGAIYQGQQQGLHAFKELSTNGNYSLKDDEVSPEGIQAGADKVRESFKGGETVTEDNLDDWLKANGFTGNEPSIKSKESKTLSNFMPGEEGDAGEEKKNLVAVHNLSLDNLQKAMEIGGLAVPSMAIMKKEHAPITGFGEISLVGNRHMIDPEVSRSNRVFAADIYSMRHPEASHQVDRAAAKDLKKEFESMRPDWHKIDPSSSPYDVVSWSNPGEGNRDRFRKEAERSGMFRTAFMEEKTGEKVKPEMEPVPLYDEAISGAKAFKKIMAEADPKELQASNYDSPIFGPDGALTRAIKAAADEIEEQYNTGDEKKAKLGTVVKKALLDRYIDDEDGSALFGRASHLVDDYRIIKENRQRINRQKIRQGVDTFINENKDEFQEWVDQKADAIFKNPTVKTSKGKMPWTLDNIVDAMIKRAPRGVEQAMTESLAKSRARSAKEFKSVEEMKKNEDLLLSSEEFETKKRETDKVFNEAVNLLGPESFDGYDNASKSLGDFLKIRGKSAGQMKSILNRNGFPDATDEAAEKMVDAAKALKAMPTEYFEAKLHRPVKLSEFSGAVIPEMPHASAKTKETIEKLKEMGLDIETYDSSKHGDRARAVQAITDRQGVAFMPGEEGVEIAGQKFVTGNPVTVPYLRRTSSATKLFGLPDQDSPFDRGYEPSGKYVMHNESGKVPPDAQNMVDSGAMEAGEVKLDSPLVLEAGSYGDASSWKRKVSEQFGGKTGKELSKAIIAAGYDGVIAIESKAARKPIIAEVVDLTTFDESKAKFMPGGGEARRTWFIRDGKRVYHKRREDGKFAPKLTLAGIQASDIESEKSNKQLAEFAP